MPDLSAARSYLYVPADRPDRLAKARNRGADAVIVDLEDAVARAAKDVARETARRWLAEQRPDGEQADWPGGQLWLRINPDLADADIGAVSAAVTGVVVPKADPGLLAAVDELLARREQALGLDRGRLLVQPLIETAAGLLEVTAIAGAPRVARLGIGEADLAAELGLRPGPAREELAPIRLQVVIASAARGIAAPAGATTTDFRDLDALRASSEALLRLGFRARTAIHPAQLAVINEVFTPSAEEIGRARRLVAAMETAERDGTGVILAEDGTMVDVAVARTAREVLARAGSSGS